MEKSYRDHGVKTIHDRLLVAAGCAQKDKAHWARRTVESYYGVASGPTVRTDGKIDVTKATSQLSFQSCGYAGYRAGKTEVSNIAGAAFQGCQALESFAYSVKPEIQWACNEFREALGVVVLNPGKDILEGDRQKVKASLESYYVGLKCAGVRAAPPLPAVASAAPLAAASAAPAKTANQLIAEINLETSSSASNRQLAKSWVDRGDYDRACSYYSQALLGLGKIYTLDLELTHVTGDPSYTAEAKRVQDIELQLRDNVKDDCKANGHPIF
jgi:tetratricopeptide (TPR) repeat protein